MDNLQLQDFSPREGYWTVKAALALTSARSAELKARPIKSAGAYVYVCLRLAPHFDSYDGRLVAVGWNHVKPTDWVSGGFEEFQDYWGSSVARPGTVGSCYNPDPEIVYEAFRAGVPAWITKALGARLFDRSGHVRRWECLSHRARRRLTFAAIAARRASAQWRYEVQYEQWTLQAAAQEFLDLSALACLGRLCPEGQRAVIDKLSKSSVFAEVVGAYYIHQLNRKVRVRDLIPALEACRPTLRALASPAGDRVRLAISISPEDAIPGVIGKRTVQLLERQFGSFAESEEIIQFLSPSFPHVPPPIARRLCLGESPVSISGGELSAREAHLWLKQGGHPVAHWLQGHYLLHRQLPRLRSVAVVRWLIEVDARGAWGQLTRTRTIHGPAGATIEVSLIDRIDEIQDEDLARGAKTLVVEAYESAARRSGEAWAEKARQDHRVLGSLPKGWRPYKHIMRPLITPAQLEREGREMGHCAGGYSSAVESGKSVILSLDVRGDRSTVELTPWGEVLQHRGPSNSDPSARCRKVLSKFLERRIHRV